MFENTFDPKDDPYGEKYIKQMADLAQGNPVEEVVPPNIITRAEWGALPAKETKPLDLPIQVALFTHTASQECNTREECVQFLQNRQKEDMEENEYNDIKYNYYIGSDRNIYEGRGCEFDADKDDDNLDIEGKSIDVGYIGDFEEKELPKDMAKLGCELIQYFAKLEKMHRNYNITTYWEDHVELLRPRTTYNALDEAMALRKSRPRGYQPDEDGDEGEEGEGFD